MCVGALESYVKLSYSGLGACEKMGGAHKPPLASSYGWMVVTGGI